VKQDGALYWTSFGPENFSVPTEGSETKNPGRFSGSTSFLTPRLCLSPPSQKQLLAAYMKCNCNGDKGTGDACVRTAFELWNPQYILLCKKCALHLDATNHECTYFNRETLEFFTSKLLNLVITKFEV